MDKLILLKINKKLATSIQFNYQILATLLGSLDQNKPELGGRDLNAKCEKLLKINEEHIVFLI